MNHEYWHSRWAENRTGFHQINVHPQLEAFWQRCKPKRTDSVLVPLCGKSLDIGWLCEHHDKVVGVELSNIAVNAYFSEQFLIPTVTQVSPRHRIYELDELTIHQTDIFSFSPESQFNLVYDRAGLIALMPEQRVEYASKLLDLLVTGGRLLLVTVVPKQPTELDRAGPPFYVDDNEMNTLFASASIQCLDTIKSSDNDRFDEKVWLIKKG